MATYYRWRQSTIGYSDTPSTKYAPTFNTTTIYYTRGSRPSNNTGVYTFQNTTTLEDDQSFTIQPGDYFGLSNPATIMYGTSWQNVTLYSDGTELILGGDNLLLQEFTIVVVAGETIGYVYSTNASSYPNGGVSGSYYYDQRTTITSPTAPTGLTYPNPIFTSSATVSWTASVTNVPIYAVSTYEVSYSTNGRSTWTVAGTTADTSLNVDLPAGATSIQFRVRAQDSNGQWSSYATGTASTVLLSPTLTVPSMAMQGQQITVNWTAIDGATSYTLQRQANTDDGWVQVYSGNALTFTETVGTWTTVQYQVQAVFSSGAGGWATSGSIPVVSASALVISGQDEDLGTLTADVPYTVSSDTGNPITLTRKVNGNLIATLTVQNGFAYAIPVVDLPTGSGTIEISATVNATSGGQVSATRTWTYTKTPFVFPNAGSTGQLTLQGNNIFPGTFAECVRVPTNWGGTLDKALELLYDAANSAVISVGTYEGSGTYGVDDPNTLTISPSPQVVTIYGGGQTLVISSTDTSSPAYISGTHVQWYSTVSAAEQMNSDGVTYSYVAVAKGVTV